jgi:hypothetical protein
MSSDKVELNLENFCSSPSNRVGQFSSSKKQIKMSVTPSPKKCPLRDNLNFQVPDITEFSSCSQSTTPTTASTFSLSCKSNMNFMSRKSEFDEMYNLSLDQEKPYSLQIEQCKYPSGGKKLIKIILLNYPQLF